MGAALYGGDRLLAPGLFDHHGGGEGLQHALREAERGAGGVARPAGEE